MQVISRNSSQFSYLTMFPGEGSLITRLYYLVSEKKKGPKLQHQGIPSDWDHCLRSGIPLQHSSEKQTTRSSSLKPGRHLRLQVGKGMTSERPTTRFLPELGTFFRSGLIKVLLMVKKDRLTGKTKYFPPLCS